ncbi:MAG: 3-hydroxyacyl-CoA dehydrogenase NAD-binding domain-containing protein [Pseudomonadota bacterium]
MFEGLKLRHWRYEKTADGLIHLVFDKADTPVNTFSRDVMAELDRLVERLRIEPPRGVIFRSGKDSGFIAGADISEFQTLFAQDAVYDTLRRGQKVFDQIEALPCTTVAAIDGFCMGGGTELALACDYRVATDASSTRIGLPEVMLGIHPGWGGTVRMPQLIGAVDAMDLILTGRGLRASVARAKGLVDDVCGRDALVATAEKRARRGKRSETSWKAKLSNSWPARQVLAKVMRGKTAAKASPKHYPAPFAAIELWRRHGGDPARMMVAEARSVAKLAKSDTARNLVRVFFLRERLRSLGDPKTAGIEHVHVIGAGIMGGDIAAWCALRGLKVTLQDREEKYVKPALERAKALFEKKLKKPADVAEARARLTMDVAGDGVAEADLVLEAIFENLEAKQALFQDCEPRMKESAILATNTSSIPLQDLRSVLERPERLIGLHFFNPVAKMLLLEIVRHDQLDPAIEERAGGFAKMIERLPVPVASTPGFLVNRILMPYLLEAFKLHQEGVPAPVIDKAAKKFGMPMGPIELADQVGLDVAASVAKVLAEAFGFDIPDDIDGMVEGGKRGKKDGEGFYKYEDGKPQKPAVDDDYVPPADLTDRMVLAYVNEAMKCLDEGVVDDADMLDAGMIFGTGFAPFRGGPWQYIADEGADVLRQRLEDLTARHGERFEPAAGWKKLGASSKQAA